ncbi:UDP-glucose 4-epimerase [Plasmodiophora brassicae]|uniref:UDP-glucose 4-epimerase n=1 Tax=Plasmodiophora brassicae TaxID=37360 RepID=A0A3P3Y4D7_PLABS|nr:unnamed protein product [Plasmodiophora brassicae]
MLICVTGGAGYVGSHVVVQLLAAGHRVAIVDSMRNASPAVIDRIEAAAKQSVLFYRVDLTDAGALDGVFARHQFDCVIHCAALKSVRDSLLQPLEYYSNDVVGAINLVRSMRDHNVHRIIFSSSATVYGNPSGFGVVSENSVMSPTTPYGRTKVIIESILSDCAAADPRLSVVILRYFNPVGAHPSGLIGEDPVGPANNLMPYICRVAVGQHQLVRIFGDDWDTPDGTPVRDYVHIEDVARAHACALDRGLRLPRGTVHVFNVGTGRGTSVKEVLSAVNVAVGRDLPFQIESRRPGDVGTLVADVSKSERVLNWTPAKTVHDACRDAVRWQLSNTGGYNQDSGGT